MTGQLRGIEAIGKFFSSSPEIEFDPFHLRIFQLINHYIKIAYFIKDGNHIWLVPFQWLNHHAKFFLR